MKRKGKRKSTRFFIILGILCILYCIAILICGFGTWFFLIWGAMGAACILLGLILGNRAWIEKLPRWFKRTAAGLFCLGLIVFGLVEGMILSGFSASAAPGADYMVVLGAQWKTSGPSEVLRRRLDRAAMYLKENPDTIVIVSGGQGGNEPISEAEGMKGYLIEAGIEEERILAEDESANTYENLVFSGKLLEKENDRVVLVTNNFHVFRATKIAEKQGYAHVEGLAASSVAGFLPNNLLREFLGVVKDFVVGNL